MRFIKQISLLLYTRRPDNCWQSTRSPGRPHTQPRGILTMKGYLCTYTILRKSMKGTFVGSVTSGSTMFHFALIIFFPSTLFLFASPSSSPLFPNSKQWERAKTERVMVSAVFVCIPINQPQFDRLLLQLNSYRASLPNKVMFKDN